MERKTNIGQECSFTFSTSFIQRSTRSLFSQLQQFLILQNFWVNISHGLIDSLFYVYTQMVKISTSMEFPSLAVSQSCHLPSTVCLIWWPSGPLPLLMKCRSLSGTLSKQAIFLEVYFCRAESTQTLIGCLGTRYSRHVTVPGFWPIRSQNSLALGTTKHSGSGARLQQPIRCWIYSARQKSTSRCSALHISFLQNLIHSFCEQLLLTTFVHNFHSQLLLKTLVHYLYSQDCL